MAKLRIVIDPTQFPGKTEADIRLLLEDAEIVLVKGIDPIGIQVGELRILTMQTKPAVKVLSEYKSFNPGSQIGNQEHLL